jgi:hypothetical protein
MAGSPDVSVRAAAKRRGNSELSLEQAERLFWARSSPRVWIDADDDQYLVGLRRTTRDLPEPPGPSRLWTCPNCSTYAIYRPTDTGNECSSCFWVQPLSSSTTPRLPVLLSPRQADGMQIIAEQRLLAGEVRSLHRRAYVRPRRQERPTGAASRLPQLLLQDASQSVPDTAAETPARRSPRSKRHAALLAASVSDSDPLSRIADAPVAPVAPLPWMAGRATPPPPPPPPPPKPKGGGPAEPPEAPAQPQPPRPASPWSLEKSIWAPRKRWSDGRALYDTDAVLRRAIEVDWKRATEGGLAKHVTRDYVNGKERSEVEMAAELDEVRQALVDHARAIFTVFDFYASLGSGGTVTTIGFNAYKQLVADAAFAIDRSKHSDDSHLDQLFVQVNSAGAVAAAAAARASGVKQTGSRAFARSETLHMLVRVAIARYILDGDETDVSQAVCRLCAHLAARLVPQAKQVPDDFRRANCYVEKVSVLLHSHRRSLRGIFEVYADFPNLKVRDDKLLSLADWMLLLRHLNFFDEAFQQREGTLCFVFARLRAVDEESERGKKRINHLSFEDFLEAIVRCATMKALPTKGELIFSGYKDAGSFLVQLRTNPAAYAQFVEHRERAWDEPLRQPIERCVEHLLSLVIRTIEVSTTGWGDGKLSKSEITRFYRQGGFRVGASNSGPGAPSAAAAPASGAPSAAGGGEEAKGLSALFGRRGSVATVGAAEEPDGDTTASSKAPANIKAGAFRWGARAKAKVGEQHVGQAQEGREQPGRADDDRTETGTAGSAGGGAAPAKSMLLAAMSKKGSA